MAKILIDRGLRSDIPLLLNGELFFCEDTFELFIGNTNGNILLNKLGQQGVKGDVGPQGVQGVAGPQGLKGDIGLQGMPGNTGTQGLKGDIGPQGMQGPAGAQGLKGDVGYQGATGPQGLTGLPADMSRVIALENKVGNLNFVVLTQTEYDSIVTKDQNTIYFIKQV